MEFNYIFISLNHTLMFGFFSKGIEYNKLAKTLGNVKGNLEKIQEAAYKTYDNSYLGPQLLLVTYVFKTDVLEKMDKYNWPTHSPIFIGNMQKKTLGEMISSIVAEIYLIAAELRFEQHVKEILTGGEAYHRMKRKQ